MEYPVVNGRILLKCVLKSNKMRGKGALNGFTGSRLGREAGFSERGNATEFSITSGRSP